MTETIHQPTMSPYGALAVIEATSTTLAGLDAIAEEAYGYATHTKAESTMRAYQSDWRHFSTWCADHALESLPAEPRTVALYLTDMARWAKAATIQRRVSSISQAHKEAGHDSPTAERIVRVTHAGIRRAIGTASHGKTPILIADVRRMVDSLPDNLKGIRDRALLLVGFAGAFRRSELVALDVADVDDTSDGLVVTIRRSKTDQEGAGRKLGVPYGSQPATCPVRALRAWLEASGIGDGPIFVPVDRNSRQSTKRLSGRAVGEVVKECCARVGLDPTKYAGHSLRSGLATSAAAAGASERSIMNQTGHKSLPMVRRYIRDGSLFRENAAGVVGL